VLLAAAPAGCGDNGSSGQPDGPPPDVHGDPQPRAIVVAGTFTPGEPGVMSELSFTEPPLVQPRVAPNGAVGSDPIVRKIGDELYIVNRADGNNVTILDADTFTLKVQISTGAGSNPQDVAVAARKLFVPAFDTAGVVVLSLDGVEGPTTIDLSALDPDGKPNCVSAYAVGDEVYVACELLDATFTPRGPGKIVVLDAVTHAVKTMFELANANPFGVFEQAPDGLLGGDLVIPTVPVFGDTSSGCIERVQTGATPKANGCVVTNMQIEGYAARVDFQPAGVTPMMWMVSSSYDTGPRGRLWGYDLALSELWSVPISPVTQTLVDLVACPNGMLVVADQTMAANGLRIYESTMERTTAVLPIGLKPGSSHGLACYE
jgi:hypothetical protein